MTTDTPTPAVNVRVRTRVQDCDTDERGKLRLIPIGTIGKAVAWDGECYDIAWDNGAWTRWTPDEVLTDADILVDDKAQP